MVAADYESPAGEWEESGEGKFFSKMHLYDMAWSGIKLGTLRTACASDGGPIATVRDESQPVAVSSTTSLRPVVKVHSACGQLLGAFAWERGSIAALGWTDGEELMVVETSGQVTLWDQAGAKLPQQFSLGEEAQREGLLHCCCYGDGVVALTRTLALWAVCGLQEPHPQRLAAPKLQQPPACMALIPPQHTVSGSLEVLLAAGSSIIVVDADSATTAATDLGAVQRLAVSPTGQFVAAFAAGGRLSVWLADFTRALSEFTTEADSPPTGLAWCGADAVAVAWPDLLLLVGPYGDWLNFGLEQPVVLVQEVDGVRVLSDTRHELLRRVPQPLVDVYRVGSTAPGALLFDARRMFDARNVRADEVLRGIAPQLPEAVGACVDAAGEEWGTARQAALLKAACYGRAFCPADSLERRRLLRAARLLRLLNALRRPDVGIPLTMAQLQARGPEAVLRRLLAAKRHLLALRVASALDLGPEQVLTDWACQKIAAAGSTGDAELQAAIAARLAGHAGVRYTDIAARAQQLGRKGLAAMLLEHESVAAEQVPLLLRLGEDLRALQRAGESGDTDLVHLVLLRMRRSLPPPEFAAAIASRPPIAKLLLAHAARTEPELLEQVCGSMGLWERVAEARLRESLARTSSVRRLRGAPGQRAHATALADAIRLLERAADFYSQTKEHGWQARAAGEAARLRRLQGELEEETGSACFVGLSVAATAQQCLRLGNARAAARVQAEFRLSDRRFWWLKARTHAAAKDWDSLAAMGQDKRAPVGLEQLVGLCREAGAPKAVSARLVARLPDGKRKAEEFTALEMYREAAETAAHARDSDMLGRIQGMVGSASPLGLAVSQLMERLPTGAR